MDAINAQQLRELPDDARKFVAQVRCRLTVPCAPPPACSASSRLKDTHVLAPAPSLGLPLVPPSCNS